MMLETLLAHLNNYFVVKDGVHQGTFTIEDGSIKLDFLQEGQFFRICGSVFNDGVYSYPAEGLTDETFDGAIWAMAVPPALYTLCSEINEWVSANPDSPYTSESFGGYSYSKATNASGTVATWQDVFRHRLNRWRKI